MDPIEIDGRINALATQRNVALSETVIIAGKLAVAEARIKTLEEELEKLKDSS